MLLATPKQNGQDDADIAVTKGSRRVKPRWKGKQKAIVRKPVPTRTAIEDQDEDKDDTEETGEQVDWTQYEPPEGLENARDVESDIILNLLKESIANVKTRILEEARRKAEAEAATLKTEQTEDTASKVADQESETDVPLTNERTPAHENRHRQAGSVSVNFAGTRLTIDEHGLLRPAPIPPKSTRRSFRGLFRRRNKSDKAESRRILSQSILELDARLDALRAKRHDSPDVLKKTVPDNSTDSSPSIHKGQVECVSCLDDFDANEVVKTPCHSYCQDCFARLITSVCEHEQHWPPKCCLNPIPEPTILASADEDVKQRYRARAEEWNIPVAERVYCHRPECSALVRPGAIDRALHVAQCAAGHWTCTLCRGQRHDDARHACPQDRDAQRTEALAAEAGWKRCVGCHAYVEHSDACQHMTCRCGAEFCYVCGARWRTCQCGMGELARVKSDARRRQEQRALQQAREDSEVAEAVRLVAEFEREEALKAELLRREQQRREAKRRRRELEVRIAREEARRAAIEARFAPLRHTLADLHALQRVAVARDLDRRAAVLQREADAARTELDEKNAAVREKLYAEAGAKLAAREKALDEELAARIKEEHRIEGQYLAQLQAYYQWLNHNSNRKGEGEEGKETDMAVATTAAAAAAADREIEKAINALRCRNDAGFAAWRKWKDGEWETYQCRVLEARDIRLESLNVAESRLDELTEQERATFRKERRAQLQWFNVVVDERQKMLAEMETAEIDNGGEDIEAWLAEEEAIASLDIPPLSSSSSPSWIPLTPGPSWPLRSTASPSSSSIWRRNDQQGVAPEISPQVNRRYNMSIGR